MQRAGGRHWETGAELAGREREVGDSGRLELSWRVGRERRARAERRTLDLNLTTPT